MGLEKFDSEANLRRDRNAKRVLRDKQVLSEIIGRWLPEYKGMTRDEIAGCIRGETAAEMRETVLETDAGRGVVLDSSFDIRLPGSDRFGSLVVAIDIQGYYQSDEEAVNRMEVYASKLLSSVEYTGGYDSVPDVRYLWVVLHPGMHNRNTVLESRTSFEKLCGPVGALLPEPRIRRMTYVGLGKPGDETGSPLLDFLNDVWGGEMELGKRLENIRMKYNIECNNMLIGGLETMGNLCEQMYRYGRDTERAEMKAEYEIKIHEDRISSSMAFLRYLINEGHSVEEALDIADVKEDLRDEVIRRLEAESSKDADRRSRADNVSDGCITQSRSLQAGIRLLPEPGD